MNKRALKDFIKNVLYRMTEWKISVKEFYSNRKRRRDRKIRLERTLLLTSHSIEKGMGLRDFQPGHSVRGVQGLLDRLNEYYRKGYDCDCFAFKEGLTAVREYIACQESFGIPKENLEGIETGYRKLVSALPEKVVSDAETYRCRAVESDYSQIADLSFEFEKFVRSRHSVRMFGSNPVAEDTVRKAVTLANYAPSACNRQANKVYFTNSAEKAEIISALITGNKGFENEIRNFILVTSSRAMFAGEEQFQWYIGGGIYLESLILSLHSLGVATCIMQWRAFYKTEKQLKKICGISSEEAIIAVVGLGEYEERTKTLAAQRMTCRDNLFLI